MASLRLLLRADGILDRSYGAYRASYIALYSSFTRAEPPTGSSDKHPGRITAIHPDFH
jgi:hypothetical protein